jgi:hypothetical protein
MRFGMSVAMRDTLTLPGYDCLKIKVARHGLPNKRSSICNKLAENY